MKDGNQDSMDIKLLTFKENVPQMIMEILNEVFNPTLSCTWQDYDNQGR